MKYAFQICTLAVLLFSFAANRRKTLQGLRIALKRFLAVLPSFSIVILLTSVILGFVSPTAIQQVLGSTSNPWAGTAAASVIGSIALMPGFVAFPLGAILRNNDISYMVISAFTTTLMMVGVVTFPVERAFLGTRVALIRNIAGLLIALAVAVATGLLFGELSQ